MATTEVFYNGDGSDVTFTIPFEYLEESDVKVSVGGTLKTQDTDYTFSTLTEITFTTAPASGTNNVRIFRDTDIDSGVRNEFFAGSAIRAQDLNDDFLQVLYSAQEIEDQFVTKSDGEFDTNVDMNSNRITELADPVDAQDAVTKQYLEDNYFDDGTETIVAAETWPDDDNTIATTAAIDNRVDSKIDSAIEDDILIDTSGLSKSATGGQVTLGIAANSVDLDRIKDSDKITLSEQESDNDQVGTDDQIFTAQAATRRFNNYYQNDAPTDTDGIGIGQVWVDPNDDLTLSVWTGSAWSSITSGGTFTNQPKVVYVDASSGDDSNDGHRISRPKKTIAAALSDINGDSDGDGSIVSVAPGIYAETLPLDIEKNDIGIIGQSLRTCIIHPKIPTADQASYDVDTPHSQELQTMFRVNSGSYFQNLTLTGMKASGTRGASGSYYTDSTHGLPPNQGWNFAFYPDAQIKKSPYIQNVTNFSDSQINNVTFTPHVPGEGAAGDLDSAPTGGGILVDGSVPASDSPLRSMVCDSYTHTALDGPGIFVTNNGYMQATSSYAFFNHAHITCINGGQANLAASTTDFGRFGLIADGKSPNPIFTSTVDGAASDGATTFNIDAPTAGSDLYGGSEAWFGDAERPATNMLVEVNSVIYPILSATANGSGWTVEVSRPDSSDRSTNLGLNGAIADAATVNFYLRSMIASSGHTMEYVGSGTNYNALPENGGVPDENDQKIELNNGKIWTATTDHNGKFTIGGNQTDDPFFEVDQQLGFVTIPEGSIAFNLLSDLTPQLGGDLDVNGNTITGLPTTPTSSTEATSKAYVDAQIAGIDEVVEDTTPQLGGDLDVNGQSIVSTSNGNITLNPNGTGDIVLDANVGIGTTSPANILHLSSTGTPTVQITDEDNSGIVKIENGSGSLFLNADTGNTVSNSRIQFGIDGSERMRIDSSGNVQVSTGQFTVGTTASTGLQFINDGTFGTINSADLVFRTNATERMRLDTSGRLLVGATSAAIGSRMDVHAGSDGSNIFGVTGADQSSEFLALGVTSSEAVLTAGNASSNGTSLVIRTANSSGAESESMRIDSSGNVGIGTTSPNSNGLLTIAGNLVFPSASQGLVDDTGNQILQRITGGNIDIGNGSWNNVRIYTASTEQMRIDSSGNVGIGTSSPVRGLHLATSGVNNVYFHLTHDGTGHTNTDGADIRLNRSTDTLDIMNLENQAITFHTNGENERMRIDTSGRLLVGTTSSSAASKLVVQGNTGGNTVGRATIAFGGTSPASTEDLGILSFTDSGNGEGALIAAVRDGGTWTSGSSHPTRLLFATTADGASSATERMRIASSGYVEIGNTQDANSYLLVNTISNQNAVFNRTGTDGTLIIFRHAGVAEGTISVSGNTVSYNGGHLSRWSQLAGGAERTEILRGSVLSNLDEMCAWTHAAQDAVLYTEEDELPEGVSVGDVKTPAVDAYTEDNEQLNRMKVSDVEGDVNVAGVFQAWDDDDDTYTNDFYCAMTGDFVIRIAQGTTVARGDLLMSAGDGTAKPQDDDIVRSKTIAKVTSTTVSTTYADGSYCVPCVLMAC